MALEWLYTTRRPSDEHVTPPVAVRRVAAVLAVAAYPMSQLLISADIEVLPGLSDVAYVLLTIVVVLGWLISIGVIYEFRRRLAQARDDQLDERERTIRDEAYLISYRILGGIIVLLALAALAIVPAFTGSREVSLDLVLHAFSSLVIATVAMPSAVVAWRDTEVGELDDEALDAEVA